MTSSSVDQRLGHCDRVDRPIAGSPDRFARDRPKVRLQASDLVGVDEPLVGSEHVVVRPCLLAPGQRSAPAHNDTGHVALEPSPFLERRPP
jgi:hypothetical protein